MKVAIDGQLFLKGDKTGIGWCAYNVLKNLPKENIEYAINFFSFNHSEDKNEDLEMFQSLGYQLDRSIFSDVIYKLLCCFVSLPYRFFFGKSADISLFFNYIVPPGVHGKSVVIIHDMGYLDCPETVRYKTKKYLEISLKKSCKRADKIITISEFSKSRIIKHLSIEKDKIEVVPLGVDTDLYHSCYSQIDIDIVKKKYNIKRDYFLYLGTIEPRKNIERLIRAYAILVADNSEAPTLVLAGKKGWLYEDIFKSVEELNLEGRVIFLGYIDKTEAPKLLSGARAFVFPSLYEGFGMPPLEAMACGTPVIASNTSSLPEVIGDAGILVNPLNLHEIKDAMQEIIYNQELHSELVQKGLAHSKKYIWKATAFQIEQILKNVIGSV